SAIADGAETTVAIPRLEMTSRAAFGYLAALCATAGVACASAANPAAPAARLRRPVAAAGLPDGRTVCVAHRSGSASLAALPGRRVRDELTVGMRLTGLAALPDRRHVLVTDEGRHELIVLDLAGARPAVRARLPVGPYPASVAVLRGGTRATVASLW